MNRNIKITIQYDGTDFNGWQIQPAKRTIQGEIESALKIIFKTHVRLHGSGRTDTGVHALGQVANFTTESKLPCTKIKKAINNNIGTDVTIVAVEEVDPQFHSQYSTKLKTYLYRITTSEELNPLERRYFVHHPHPLNITQMCKSARQLTGTHDFKSFQSNNRVNKNKNTVRTIKAIKITKTNHHINISISADGFLYKMVRNIIGVLLDVGIGKLTDKDVARIIQSKNRRVASKSVPAHGLILHTVAY